MYHIINALNMSNQAHVIMLPRHLYNVATIGMTWASNDRPKINDKEQRTFYQFSLQMQLLAQCQTTKLLDVKTLQV
jgi:hypothetical protein